MSNFCILSLSIILMTNTCDYINIDKSIDNIKIELVNLNDNLTNINDLYYTEFKDNKARITTYSMPINKEYIISDCKKYIIQNTAFIQNGYVMIPLKDVMNVLSEKNSNSYSFYLKYIENEGGIIQVTSIAGRKLNIYIKDNIIEDSVSKEKYHIEGKIEIISGVEYIPYTKENFKLIFNESYYDDEKKVLNFRVWKEEYYEENSMFYN